MKIKSFCMICGIISLCLIIPSCEIGWSSETSMINYEGHNYSMVYNCIIYADGKFVIGGKDGKMACSEDGEQWIGINGAVEIFNESNINGIAYGNGKYVIVGGIYGGTSRLAYSDDCLNWINIEEIENIFSDSIIWGITYGDGKFVAVGGYGIIVYSYDGVIWESASGTSLDFGLSCVTYGNGIFIAGGTMGKIYYSRDGLKWIDIDFNDMPINKIVFGDDKFLAIGDEGKIACSSDGISWTSIEPKTNIISKESVIMAVAYGRSDWVFFTIQANKNIKNYVYSNSVFSHWRNEIFDSNGLITDITYANRRFVAVGTEGIKWYSIKKNGFFSGIWHGIRLPFVLVVNIFRNNKIPYISDFSDPMSTTKGYTFGYILGIFSFLLLIGLIRSIVGGNYGYKR